MRNAGLAGAALALALAAASHGAQAQMQKAGNGPYIGTVAVDGTDVFISVCDGSRKIYVLQDMEDSDLVANLRRAPKPYLGIWYAEVSGEPFEMEDGNGLRVSAIRNLVPGRSCHVTRPEQRYRPSPDVSAGGFDPAAVP